MNKKVASLESQMDARVNEAMHLALSQQRTIVGSQQDVVISWPLSDVEAVHPRRRPTYQLSTLRLRQQRRSAKDTQWMISPWQRHVSYMWEQKYICSCSIRVNHTSDSWKYNSWKVDSPWLHLCHSRADSWNERRQWESRARFHWRGWREDIGNALHGVILWRKADIKITGNRKAPVDPLSPPDAANDDRDHFAQPPSASSSLGLKIG